MGVLKLRFQRVTRSLKQFYTYRYGTLTFDIELNFNTESWRYGYHHPLKLRIRCVYRLLRVYHEGFLNGTQVILAMLHNDGSCMVTYCFLQRAYNNILIVYHYIILYAILPVTFKVLLIDQKLLTRFKHGCLNRYCCGSALFSFGQLVQTFIDTLSVYCMFDN